MVLGSLGLFGGNERSTAAPSTTAKTTKVAAQHPAAKTTSTFAPALKQAIHSTPAVSQKVAASAKSAPVRDTISPSLSLVTGLPPLTTPTTTPTTPTKTSINAPAAADPPAPSVVDTLKAALVANGVDISGMQFTEHRDLVTYPGGSFINDIISLQTDSGRTHDYMTDLVALSPQVTVNEIQQLMAGNRG